STGPSLSARSEIASGYPSQLGILRNTFAQSPVRVLSRLVWLLAELVRASFDYVFFVPHRQGASARRARAIWLQRTCRRLLRVFNLSLKISGPIPARGLLVSNHLSYLDIVALGAISPSIFVAKQEVRNWPIFGWFARMAGTIFVCRERRSDVAHATAEI